ncbi:MAG: hypothetical protein Q7S27_00315 [Nanoarchaeota archaeon]|nr:hypothetical protein [Nanoarchaeota archaeon]
MKIQPYVDKLTASSQYKEFNKKYSDAFIAAGFFVIDLEMGKNVHQIDYYIPSQKKFAAFSLDKGVNFQILDSVTDHVPEKLDIQTRIDLEALPGILLDEMKNRSITEDIKKIIAIVQNIKGKRVWNINSVLSGMDILKAHIDDASETVLKMEKTSFVEIMKKIPVDQMKAMNGGKLMPKGQMPEQGEEGEEASGGNPLDELKKLNKLEQAIQKEKSRLNGELIQAEKKNGIKNDKKVNGKVKRK